MDHAVSHHALERLAEGLGGSLHVVQQPQLAQLETLGETKSEKLVLQLVRYKIEESDLIPDPDANVWILDLLNGQSRALDQRLDIETSRRLHIGCSRYAASGGRERREPRIIGFAHAICLVCDMPGLTGRSLQLACTVKHLASDVSAMCALPPICALLRVYG